MISGVFNILKPPGMTSHDVVWQVRKIVGCKKVGHAGTLDPDAAGVLPVFVGDATRLIEYASNADKCYRVEIALGIKTDTGDDSGQIIATKEFEAISQTDIEKAIQHFTGEILQIPPMYSALKYEGKKLYQLAREGKTVERQPRTIFIKEIQLLHFGTQTMLLQVACSKGTYIRTLIEDFAEFLGTVATVKFLLRTRAGIFSLEDACLLDDMVLDYNKLMLPYELAIEHLPKITLTQNQSLRFCQGVKTTFAHEKEDIVRVYSNEEKFLGIGLLSEQLLKPKKVFYQYDLQ